MKALHTGRTLLFLSLCSIALLGLQGCIVYEEASGDYRDGIYYDGKPEYQVQKDTQRGVEQGDNLQADLYEDYFGQKAREYGELLDDEVFTDVESYTSDSDSIPEMGADLAYRGNPGWGDSDTNVTINYYDQGWNTWGLYGAGWGGFWDPWWGVPYWGWRGGQFGLGWNFGWNNWISWQWGWGAWGNPYWGGPWYGPGYGWGWGGWNAWGPWGWGYNNNVYGYNRYNRGYTRASGPIASRYSTARSNLNTPRPTYLDSRSSRSNLNSRSESFRRNTYYRSSRSNRASGVYDRSSSSRYRSTNPFSRSTYNNSSGTRRSGSYNRSSSGRSGSYNRSSSGRSGSYNRSSSGGGRSSGAGRSSGGSRSSGGGGSRSGGSRSGGGRS